MELVIDGYIFEIQAQGGISRIFNEILPRMCDLDNTLNILLFLQKPSSQQLPIHPQISINLLKIYTYLRPRRFWSFFNDYFEFREDIQSLFIHKHRNAIWHSTYFTNPKNWYGPVVLTVHDLIYERFIDLYNSPYDNRFRNQKRKCIAISDAIIADSMTTKLDIKDYYGVPSEKISVIPIAYNPLFTKINFDEVPLEVNLNTRKPFFLYVGNRTHHKNFITLIDAYSNWKKKDEIDLVVVGENWDDQEKKYLINNHLTDAVHLLMNVSDKELCSLYNLSFALLYPSIYEGFGIPLLEAMACGCPIVASKIPSTIEVASDCPIYFDPVDKESLRNALDIIYTEGRKPERIKAGVDRVKEYSFDKTAKKTLHLYQSLI